MSLSPCRFPMRKSTIESILSLIFTKGNVHRAEDSHVRHEVDMFLSSVTTPALRHLDHTRPHPAAAGDTDRPFQEQVPTRGRKRPLTSATHHPASTGETACLLCWLLRISVRKIEEL